jgi:DnaK suppressor protein
MTNTERNKFRKALEARLAAIGDGGANREALAIDTSPDEMDRIQHATERDYAVSSLERDASRLRELRAAILRVDAGTFGICVGCEERISPKRLAAIPWASFCIVCQEAADREQKAPPDEIDRSIVIAA